MDLAWIVSSSRSSLSFVSRGRGCDARLLPTFLSFSFSSSLPAVSIEKPPVSYYSPAVCHCARRTKRHGADPCLIRPKYSANIRMNARPKRQAGKVHGPGKDVLKGCRKRREARHHDATADNLGRECDAINRPVSNCR